jgi:1,4-alpha-glucan branching enzyme
VIGEFNFWQEEAHPLEPRWDGSGIWEGFIPHIGQGTLYKYKIYSNNWGQVLEKADPFALYAEVPPQTASVVRDLSYQWKDKKWMDKRKEHNALNKPYSVYEVHLGSWRRRPEDGNRSLHYTELAEELTAYVKEMGFTHVEFMPVMEHPFFGSWGYQVTGFYAPSSRYGTPEEFMQLVDALHQNGIGVILDWVPSHFPTDSFALANFDGTSLYEHADPQQGFHPDWGSFIFNYGRNEVRAFLISNALFWLEKYHADGLRVDAVASMLYLDYSRKEGEWIPNMFGGRENLEAISFLREFNEAVYAQFPDVQTIAEESTAFSGVSRPTYIGGLGFGMKWMMGWMHDTLSYFKRPAIFRRWHQNEITFSMVYAFSERFMLPLSHDEVVHMKASLLYKMPGDEAQKFANLRCLFGHQWMHPGTQILFMGGEIGQTTEWSHDLGVPWQLLEYNYHQGIQRWVKALNELYSSRPALWRNAFHPDGYQWISGGDTENSVLVFVRRGNEEDPMLLVVCHFNVNYMPVYSVGVPHSGVWREVLNSDDVSFGGSGILNGDLKAENKPEHGCDYSITFKLPPLSVLVFEGEKPAKKGKASKEKPAPKKAKAGKKS